MRSAAKPTASFPAMAEALWHATRKEAACKSIPMSNKYGIFETSSA